MRTAIVTGGTRGLGRSISERLLEDGWRVVFDARTEQDVRDTLTALSRHGDRVAGLAGDVGDRSHRRDLARAVDGLPLHLLVNNAGSLGPTPLPRLQHLEDAAFVELLTANAVAPLGLFSELAPSLEAAPGVVVNVSSDAAVEAYGGWGAYGASKAALDHLSRVLAVEHPDLAIYSFDPGDMRTDMHQAAFPGEDISDRPTPDTVVPALIRLITSDLPSGRYTASQLSSLPVSR